METESDSSICSRCKLLEAEIAGLKATLAEQGKLIKELSAKLDAALRAKKRQAAPFRKSNSQKKPKEKHKKPGRAAEHPAANRPEPTPDQIHRTIEVPVDQCPDCRVALEDIYTQVQYQSDSPSTNNYAERSLRGAVLLRKVGCCNRTERGVQAFETLSSLLATFQKRGMDFTEWLKHRLSVTGPQEIPPQLLPANCPTLIVVNPHSDQDPPSDEQKPPLRLTTSGDCASQH